MSTHLERRIAALRKKYEHRGGRMYAGDIAIEEGCSPRTALRMISAGDFGEVHSRNPRVKWVLVDGYCEYLSTKTVVLKASA
jgi:hypothetical protein